MISRYRDLVNVGPGLINPLNAKTNNHHLCHHRARYYCRRSSSSSFCVGLLLITPVGAEHSRKEMRSLLPRECGVMQASS